MQQLLGFIPKYFARMERRIFLKIKAKFSEITVAIAEKIQGIFSTQ